MSSALILTLLYSGNVLLAVFAYIPQIYKIIKNPEGHTGNSLWAWFLWTYTSLVELVYGIFILKDTTTIIVFAVGFLGCFGVMILTIYYRFLRKIPCMKL